MTPQQESTLRDLRSRLQMLQAQGYALVQTSIGFKHENCIGQVTSGRDTLTMRLRSYDLNDRMHEGLAQAIAFLVPEKATAFDFIQLDFSETVNGDGTGSCELIASGPMRNGVLF
jgi:hypothetical protein